MNNQSQSFFYVLLGSLLFLQVNLSAKVSALGINAKEDIVNVQEWEKGYQFNETVKKYVKEYTGPGRIETAKILGRGITLFPVFSRHLSEKGLPLGLKYIPMIESGLRLEAHSYAGASGPWQFMAQTARFYGLTVNDTLDERDDIHRSSAAAAEFLSDLHRQFCDWELVLAAYNCGPGRLRQAIRKANSNRFIDLRPYLPSQTQQYVAKFKAATYVANHYASYDIEPFQRSSENEETEQDLLRKNSECGIDSLECKYDEVLNNSVGYTSILAQAKFKTLNVYMNLDVLFASVFPSQKPIKGRQKVKHIGSVTIRELPETSTPLANSKHRIVIDSILSFVRRPILKNNKTGIWWTLERGVHFFILAPPAVPERYWS
ncbi:MAG: lytic transglycosylase domain-containing protein [Saprospiraceae bacterium]|nr:lytic transglycosylase domain-containing protein [Saprospiraceae bacterium]